MQSIAPAPVPQLHHHQEMSADNDLRAQLAAAINPSQHPSQHNPHGYNDPRASSSASPHEHILDPAIGGGGGGPGGMMSAGGDSGDDNGDGRKGGKRELSQSKRAAQNRAAQRAFRQRKEGYIKKLEEQVRELHALEDQFKGVQAENYSLREYIIHLQSRLLETQGDLPPPPPNITLTHPSQGYPPVRNPESGSSAAAGGAGGPLSQISQLQAAAARNIAAASLQSGKQQDEHRFKSDEGSAADAEAIRSQLQGS